MLGQVWTVKWMCVFATDDFYLIRVLMFLLLSFLFISMCVRLKIFCSKCFIHPLWPFFIFKNILVLFSEFTYWIIIHIRWISKIISICRASLCNLLMLNMFYFVNMKYSVHFIDCQEVDLRFLDMAVLLISIYTIFIIQYIK